MSGGPARIAVLMSLSGEGGVERMVMNLIGEFARKGLVVDFLTIRDASAHAQRIPPGVRHLPLQARHTLTAIPELVRYLRHERPDAFLVAKDRAGRAASLARWWARSQVPLMVRLGTNLSAALERRSRLARWWRLFPMRFLYARVDGVIAVSEGVAEDACKTTGLSRARVHVVRNPVITPALREQAAEACPHEWLADSRVPAIVGVGRLTRQKDFPTLVRAFARLREERKCRLIILGDGQLRKQLVVLAQELGVADDVLLAGFQPNPYAWVSRARLFVLSSAWEGSPNALTEALALGVPVVSTDCPSGPREILCDGAFGELVRIGDWQTMAAAMARTLDAPLGADELRGAAAEYEVGVSATRYLGLLGIDAPAREPDSG